MLPFIKVIKYKNFLTICRGRETSSLLQINFAQVVISRRSDTFMAINDDRICERKNDGGPTMEPSSWNLPGEKPAWT